MLSSAINEINTLTHSELEQISDYVEQKLLFGTPNADILKQIQDKKYPTRIVCPHCGSVLVVKYGKYNDKQRYKCRDCNKTFNIFTGTIIHNSKIPLNVWSEFAKMILNNKCSLREAAKKLTLSLPTVFEMRHKLLNRLAEIFHAEEMSGKIQIDETYIPESFKGNHKSSKTFVMPRPPYKRGGCRTSAFGDKFCIITGIDASNNLWMKAEGIGKPGLMQIYDALKDNIQYNSIMITDGLGGYKSLAADLSCCHEIVVSSTKSNKKGYNLNKINSVHSLFKRWMRSFGGIATKYIDDYVVWFNWLYRTKSVRDIDKYKQLLVDCIV